MTDEEMAEEYARNEMPFDILENGEKIYTENDIKEAHLAGLKAGRPKWHKVADGDLPKKEDLEMQVLCFTHDGYQLLSLFSDPKPIFKHYEVIAWCEMSEYTEV